MKFALSITVVYCKRKKSCIFHLSLYIFVLLPTIILVPREPECRCVSICIFFIHFPSPPFLSFLHVASIPQFKIASFFLKDRGPPFYSNFYLDKVGLQLIRKQFRQYLNANALWKSVPSPRRSGFSLFPQRATVASFFFFLSYLATPGVVLLEPSLLPVHGRVVASPRRPVLL